MPARTILSACVALMFAILLCVRGCGRYGDVNALTFEYAKALYAACNARQPERLRLCVNLITAAESSQQISTRESRYLREIIDAARAEEWDDAQGMARQLMIDQAGRRQPVE